MAAYYHVRSCSLPARLHSNSLYNHIQQLLNKFPIDNNTNSLSLLSQLHDSISHLLQDLSPSSLLHSHDHSFFTHLLDVSLVHLDLCSKLRDITYRIKDCLRDLRSAFRRRRHGRHGDGVDSTIHGHVKSFMRSRKVIHKDLAKLFLLLKQTDIPSSSVSWSSCHPLITLVQQVCNQTCHSLKTVLLSLSTSTPKSKSSRWALVTKLVIKNVTSTSVHVQTEHTSEFHVMDEELRRFFLAKEIKKEPIKCVITTLDNVNVVVEHMEESLENLYRCMIQTRVSLLNIISCNV
ncbi:unnamed protein product [Cochlearia groenlandica]